MTFTGWPAEAVEFYEGLEADNSKVYWLANKEVYENCVRAPMEALLADLAAEFGPGKLFRPYRDVRFSSDKTPYKTALSAAFARGGRKSAHACYYLQLQPGGQSFIGGGMWMPENDKLRRLREAIAQGGGAELRDATETAAVQRHFGPTPLFGEDVDRLVTAPKGFAKDHPFIAYLQLKSFVVGRALSDDVLTSPALLETVVDAFAAMVPFVHLLNSLAGMT